MEGSEGMVAVVRGLKDAGLAVTLLDSGRQYTLMPEAVTHPVCPRANISQTTASQSPRNWGASRRDSGVQATDGRYASTYKMMHCHMVPTSPPDLVTEFPPQRAELYPGHENFEIGGTGSGETYCHPTRCNNFRGGLCWTDRRDRGSVFTSKPSMQPDSFTSSLRKYPSMPQERSSEIVERLITFTQAKNLSKCHRSNSPTPIVDSDISNQALNFEADTSRNSAPTKCGNRGYEPDVCIRPKRLEESPTREKCRRCPVNHEPLEPWRRSTFCRTNDVRYLKEVSRKVKDGIRSLSNQPQNQPEKLNANDRIDVVDRKTVIQNANSVNMEIQAAVPMVSREVVTVPIIVPSQRTIAIPLTPSPSCTKLNSASDTLCRSHLKTTHRIVETIVPELHDVINVQTATSNIQIDKQKRNKYKRSKSQDEIRIMHSEIFDAIQDLHLGPCFSKFYRKSYNTINRSNKFLIKLAKNFESELNRSNNIACEHRIDIIDTNNSKNVKRSFARIFHAEIPKFRITWENDLAKIVEDWLTFIPLKLEESLEGTVDKELIFYDFFYSLKYFLRNAIELSETYKLKLDILDKLARLPIDTKCNRNLIHNRLADILIDKLQHLNRKQDCRSAYNHKKINNKFKDICSSTFERYVMPTEDEIKKFIAAELIAYLEKSCLKMNRHNINKLENDLFNYLILRMEEIQLDNDKHIRKNVIQLLKVYGFSELQAIYLTNILITHFKECFVSNLQSLKVRSETFIVLPNLQNVQISSKSSKHDSELSIESNKNQETSTLNDLNSYNDELRRQIDEWMSSLQLQILESKDSGLRQVVISDLAGDIIDRRKYLELNPSSRGTDEAELEHLKYQIFKWINKLVGEDNLSPIENAHELMKRIRALNIPLFSNSRKVNKSDWMENNITIRNQRPLSCGHSICDINIKNKENVPKFKQNCHTDGQMDINFTNTKKNNAMNITDAGTSKNKITAEDSRPKIKSDQIPTASCYLGIKNSSQSKKTNEQLEAEYEQYVKDWVQQIPVRTNDPKDELLAEKIRLDIHKSLWKMVSKLSCDPATYYNRFFFEDLLDDAIDDLLDSLPQTPGLKSQRNRLKLEFIENTINIIDNIKAKEDTSFKHKLVKNVVTNLRKEGLINSDCEDAIKLYEDLQIIKLVEEYLLYIRFKNEDQVASEILKKKLLQRIGEFIEDLKKNHTKELSDIDISSCTTNIMNILQKVPLPNEKSIKEEADDILLGLEIEQWYSDLPIILNDDPVSLYQRKRQLEIFATKIKEIVNNMSVDNCDNDLKNEVSRFLEKILLDNGDSLNMNFMVEELVNRINNIKKQGTSQSTKRVVFQAPGNYENFERDIPYTSSFIEIQPLYRNLQSVSQTDVSYKNFNQTSQCDKSCLNNISEQVPLTNSALEIFPNKKIIVSNQEPPDYRIFSDTRPFSSSYKEQSNQWYSLRETPKSAMTQSDLQNYKSFDTNNGLENNAVQQTSGSYSQNKIDKNQIEISQLVGPSRCKQNCVESSKNCSLMNPCELFNGTINSSIADQKDKDFREIKQQENFKIDDKLSAKVERNESGHKCSIESQVFKAEHFDQIVDTNRHHSCSAKQMNVATTTSSSNMSISGHPFQKTTTSTQSSPNKKRGKWALSERDTVRRHLSFNDSDEGEDDVHCRCIERYWKCRRRPKYFSCEDFDDLPPCLPVLFPYPCFF